MPVTTIQIAQGKPKAFLRKLMDTVHQVLVATLQIPDDDRNIRLMEFDPELFDAKKPYEVFVEITMFPGRSKDRKKLLYKNLVTQLHEALSINPLSVFIILHEPPMENWGIRGGQAADEVDLGFKVNI